MDQSHELNREAIAAEIAYEHQGTFTLDEVREFVDRAAESLLTDAKIARHVPLLVSRYARELLTASAQTKGLIAKKVPELLFVCVQNAGRSQIAAAIAAHLAPGKVHVRSAGSQPTGEINPLAVQVLAERGIELAEAYPKPLSDDVLHAADVIVTMGCGDECPYFPGKRYEDWDVSDPEGATLEEARDIRDDIQRRVTDLLRDLAV